MAVNRKLRLVSIIIVLFALTPLIFSLSVKAIYLFPAIGPITGASGYTQTAILFHHYFVGILLVILSRVMYAVIFRGFRMPLRDAIVLLFSLLGISLAMSAVYFFWPFSNLIANTYPVYTILLPFLIIYFDVVKSVMGNRGDPGNKIKGVGKNKQNKRGRP